MILVTVCTPEYAPGAIALAKSLRANSELKDTGLRALCFNFTSAELWGLESNGITTLTPQLRYAYVYRDWAAKYRQWTFSSVRIHYQDFFPGVERILHLDSDCLCLGSLRELETLKFDGAPWAAVPSLQEPTLGHQTNEAKESTIGRMPASNSGVMLYNMPEWVARHSTERFIDNSPYSRFDHPLNGEGLMNFIDRGVWQPLPQKFNTSTSAYNPDVDTRIIHAKGARKPWEPNGRGREYWKPYLDAA